ncbi:K Homology domain, type 1 [Dillenia turbinata]|uniref:K Homology domain, type 1 n=1 Tax=Dillenia turbinata TaxID=194707 RepID=A0AAN8ZG09_9MAGN
MDRSRSKRNYYYDSQDYESETLARSKPRYSNHSSHSSNHHHHNHRRGFSRNSKNNDLMVTTSYRILCHDHRAGGVIGKSGSIIKAIRQHTGAFINVHELIPGDEERIIEISDTRRRDPDGRMPAFSPAQEALFLIHDRILESDGGPYGYGGYGGDEDDDYVLRGGNRVVTRMVVSKLHVGSLLGKGGKIIEQMRMETKTHIRILPRDRSLPQCVEPTEEIVQVTGDINNVKNAISIISARLRESQHRDRSQFYGRLHSPDRFFPPEDDFLPHMNTTPRRDGPTYGSQGNNRSNNYASHPSSYELESGIAPTDGDLELFSGEDLVFRILCPAEKIDVVVGESDGILDLLQNEIGVDIKITDPVAGSDERIVIISSDEGPDDELFPAQEALLHIQTRIVNLVPDKDNIVTTRLVVPSSDICCLDRKDGSLSELRKTTGANIQILPREELPACVSGMDDVIQIVGEIKAARDVILEITARLRSYIYREFLDKDMLPPSTSAQGSVGTEMALEAVSPHKISPREGYPGNDPATASHQSSQSVTTAHLPKDAGGGGSDVTKPNESELQEDAPSGMNRVPVPLVTRSILEVIIPEPAVPKLITKSKNKLQQISELSGATITQVEDRQEVREKIIQIAGTPEQAERAQSLLQGFILSTLEDGL